MVVGDLNDEIGEEVNVHSRADGTARRADMFPLVETKLYEK